MRKRSVLFTCAVVLATGASIVGVSAAQNPTGFNPYGTPVNGCANPILATDNNGWGSDTPGATATRGQPGDHVVAEWDYNLRNTTAGTARIWMPRRTVAAGQTWELSSDVRTNADPATAVVQADWFSSTGAYIRSDQSAPFDIPGTRPYTRVSGTFTAPAGAGQVSELVVMSGLNANSGFATTMCTYRPGTVTTPPPTTTTVVPPPPVTTTVPPPPAGTVLFNGDFETGNFNQWPLCQTRFYNGACSGMPANYPLTIEHPGRQGNSQARIEVRDGDQPFCCGERAQLVGPGNETEGKDLWYSWSGMVDQTTFPINNSWQVLMQWHSDVDGSPPLTFDAEGNNLVLETRPRPNEPYTGITNVWTTPLNPGQWHDIKLHVKWSANASVGFVELWQNGIRQNFTATPSEHGNGQSCVGANRCGFRNIYPGDSGNRPMVTYYRDQGINGTGVVHHDNFKVATTEAALG